MDSTTGGISGGGSSGAKEAELRNLNKFHRLKAIWKKAEELSILCDIPVCLILDSPGGKKETWPQNANDVRALVDEYAKRGGECERRKLMKRRRDDHVVAAASGEAENKRQKTTGIEDNFEAMMDLAVALLGQWEAVENSEISECQQTIPPSAAYPWNGMNSGFEVAHEWNRMRDNSLISSYREGNYPAEYQLGWGIRGV